MLCQCAPKLTPLQSRFLASVVALALLGVIYWSLSNPHFAYAAELEFDGRGRLRSGGEDHNWHRIAEQYSELDELEVDDDEDEHGEQRSTVRQARPPPASTIGGNNNANIDNIVPGATTVWVFPEEQLMSEHAERGPGLPSDERAIAEVEERHAELRRRDDHSGLDQSGDLEPRQNGDRRRIFVSINTCLQPTYTGDDVQLEAPPQLTLYVATSADNTNPGPDSEGSPQTRIPLDEGYANHTIEAQGDWYMAVHAPQLPDGFRGVWNYELAVSIDDYYHSLGRNGSNLFLIDSDSTAALLVTNNLTQANASQSSYKEWLDLTAPYIVFASNAANTRTMGIQKSYCGLEKVSQIVGDQDDPDGENTHVQMEMITRGLGQKPKEQFYVTNLNSSSRYNAILARPGNSTNVGNGVVGGGGKVWSPVPFRTKSDNNCALLFNLDFCDQVAYAVPSTPDIVSDPARFGGFYDDYTRKYYQHFNFSLQQIACQTSPDSQYSLAKNCDDCARAYKEWLCAVSIPRCEDFSSEEGFLQVRNVGQPFINGSSLSEEYLNTSYTPMYNAPTLDGSVAFQQTLKSSVATNQSRNAEIDRVIQPGPYKEVLPCEDLCYSLVQSCPAALGFGCPSPGKGLEVGYGTREGIPEGRLTCSYLGAYVYTDAAPVMVAPGLIWVVGVAVLVGRVAMRLNCDEHGDRNHEAGDEDISELYSSVRLEEPNSIRVIDLLPNYDRKLDAEIKLELRAVKLASSPYYEAPYYEALSYTWGKSKSAKQITVNHKYRMPVTDNLFNALYGLRRRKKKRTMFVDQICIYQNNTVERNHQVAQMGRIYLEAALVNVWTGRPERTLPIVASPFRWIGFLFAGCFYRSRQFDLAKKDARDRWRAVKALMQNYDEEARNASYHTQPRWNERSWTVQEFLLARDIYICCGRKRWRFSEVWLEFIVENSPSYIMNELYELAKYRQSLALHREIATFTTIQGLNLPCPNSLYETIFSGILKPGGASNPKDYVYSMLGFLDAEEANFIGCDYNLHRAQIYARATYASVRKRKNFDILEAVTLQSTRDIPGLASWAVDFSKAKTWLYRRQDRERRDIQNNRPHLDYCLFSRELNIPSADATFEPINGRPSMAGNLLDVVTDVLSLKWKWGDIRGKGWSVARELTRSEPNEFMLNAAASLASQLQRTRLTQLMERMPLLCTPSTSRSYHTSTVDQAPTIDIGEKFHLQDLYKLWASYARPKFLLGKRLTLDSTSLADAELAMINSTRGSGPLGANMFATSAGVIGLAPKTVAAGDQVILIRSHRPFIALRPEGDTFTFQGQMHIYGLPDGDKVFETWHEMGIEEEKFDLV